MSYYDYRFLVDCSVPVGTVRKIVEVALVTERTYLWESYYQDAMSRLAEEATVDSVFYSNAIELITDDRKRVAEIVAGAEPESEKDLKILGYYEARKYIYDTYTDQKLTLDYVLKIHRILMSRYDSNGGKIRQENRPHFGYGTMTAVSYTIDHSEVESRLKEMCESVEDMIGAGSVDRMLLMSTFITDFQSLSPFLNGNGRMYRLLTEYLCLRLGIRICRYMSIDRELFFDVKGHADAIHRSTVGVNNNKDYTPMMVNYIECIWEASEKLNRVLP